MRMSMVLALLVILVALYACAPQMSAEGPHRRRSLPTADEIKKLPPDGGPDYNRLVFEKSPYLLQHAGNPIDWHAWGDAAFEKARKEVKPIFLSIGYSTCHWCHVMERESFEDAEVAEVMNKHFVPIKVDREEREDVDNVYMAVCIAVNGHGGWPLTILMTPDRKPFLAGTYFPKEGAARRPGLMDILKAVAELWAKDRQRLTKNADEITEMVKGQSKSRGGGAVGVEALAAGFEQFSDRFDPEHGGFGQQPKFPTPHDYSFLLRYWRRSGRAAALEMVRRSLGAMRFGGMYDHVGFGFHRYSTDRRWLLPHFEKMLYDQAMLAIAYAEAYQATRDGSFAQVTREILEYVSRDMSSPEGAFYSAEDADSEGEEGKFYLWTEAELVRDLGESDGRFFSKMFGFTAEGNFEDQSSGRPVGANIVHLERPMDEAASKRWETARRKLFEAREKRVRPHKDDKVLTAWNGLMIAAFAKAAQILDEPAYVQAASRAADFVLSKLRRADGRLLRRFRDGEASIPAFLDDYAFLVWGLLELYEAGFDARYLAEAAKLNREMLGLFWDAEGGGLYFDASDGEKLIMRKKEIYDGAVPSGNSVAALNLLRLGRIAADAELERRAEAVFKAFSGDLTRAPSGHAQALIALDFAAGPAREI
ncbi:MAG TPA: thioredoxin domain-containing protein, partial [Planctomycetota bacterium]|nr:thioredoxin domain-containing protein [Planctomycetota bacterium]